MNINKGGLFLFCCNRTLCRVYYTIQSCWSTFKLIHFHRHFKVRLLVKRVSFFDTIIFLQISSTVDMGIEVPNACSLDMPRIFQLGSLNHVVCVSLAGQVEIFGVRLEDFHVNWKHAFAISIPISSVVYQ